MFMFYIYFDSIKSKKYSTIKKWSENNSLTIKTTALKIQTIYIMSLKTVHHHTSPSRFPHPSFSFRFPQNQGTIGAASPDAVQLPGFGFGLMEPCTCSLQETWQINGYQNLRDKDVSKNRGTPKSSILIGFSLINHPFWGTPSFGNTQINLRKNLPKVEGFFSDLLEKNLFNQIRFIMLFLLLIPLRPKMIQYTSLRRSFSQKALKPWVIQQTFVVFRWTKWKAQGLPTVSHQEADRRKGNLRSTTLISTYGIAASIVDPHVASIGP